MKKIILLLSITIVVTFAKAQETHRYISSITRYFDQDGKPIKWGYSVTSGGTFKIGKNIVSFDMKSSSRKVYGIADSGKWEPYDEGYSFKEMKVYEIFGSNAVLFSRMMLLRDPKGIISDIMVKYPDKEVSYRTRPYKPNEYGYKLEHSAETSIKRD